MLSYSTCVNSIDSITGHIISYFHSGSIQLNSFYLKLTRLKFIRLNKISNNRSASVLRSVLYIAVCGSEHTTGVLLTTADYLMYLDSSVNPET